MACQIKVSVKAVKQGVDTLQVLSSNPALCNYSSWPEKLAIRHQGRQTRQINRQVDGQPATLSVRWCKHLQIQASTPSRVLLNSNKK